MQKKDLNKKYGVFLKEVKQRIKFAQYAALQAVNKELINLYWDIGKIIVEKQKQEKWGKSVVERLAGDLQKEFVGIRGFSARNIWRMRDFYLTYQENQILPPMVAEIGWSHNIVIMEKCKDPIQREYYIKMTRKYGWTKNLLINHIENQNFEKTVTNQVSVNKIISDNVSRQTELAVKDEYIFDFLELGEAYSEQELEQGLILKKVLK